MLGCGPPAVLDPLRSVVGGPWFSSKEMFHIQCWFLQVDQSER